MSPTCRHNPLWARSPIVLLVRIRGLRIERLGRAFAWGCDPYESSEVLKRSRRGETRRGRRSDLEDEADQIHPYGAAERSRTLDIDAGAILRATPKYDLGAIARYL